MKSWCKKLLTAGLIFMTAVAAVKTPMPVYADEVSGNSVQYITDDDRWRASVELKNYKESLIKRENPEQYIIDDLDDIMYSGQYYIANSEYMTPDAMWSYVGKVKAEMDTAIGKSSADVSYGLRADIITGLCFVEYLFDEHTHHKCATEYRQFKPRHKVGYCFADAVSA